MIATKITTICRDNGWMNEHSDGDWVRYEDYRQLERQLEDSVSKREVARAVWWFHPYNGTLQLNTYDERIIDRKIRKLGITPDMAKEDGR